MTAGQPTGTDDADEYRSAARDLGGTKTLASLHRLCWGAGPGVAFGLCERRSSHFLAVVVRG